MTFGKKLQILRQKAGMSQDALAEKLNVSRQAVSRWERNETMPETEKVVDLAELFGITTDYLLRDQTEGSPEPSQQEIGAGQTEALFRQHLGTLEQAAGWTLTTWGTLQILVLLLLDGDLWLNVPMFALRTWIFPVLFAGLKIGSGIWLIRLGKQYAAHKKERR